MARRDWREQRERNCTALMERLRWAAQHKEPCPTCEQLARTLNLNFDMVRRLFRYLRQRGDIEWDTLFCARGGRRKIVVLLHESITTAWPARATAERNVVRSAPLTSDLQRAKTCLQRAGHYVWDAPVSGGPPGLVRVDNDLLTEREVLALARVENH